MMKRNAAFVLALTLCLAGCGQSKESGAAEVPSANTVDISAESVEEPTPVPTAEPTAVATPAPEETPAEPTAITPAEEPSDATPTEEPSDVAPTDEPSDVAPTEEPSDETPEEEPSDVSPTEEPSDTEDGEGLDFQDDSDFDHEDDGSDVYDQLGVTIEEAINIINANRHEGDEKADPYVESAKWRDLSEERLAVYREVEEKVENLEPYTYTVDEYGYDYLDTIYSILPALSSDRPDLDICFAVEDIFEGDRQTALKLKYLYPGNDDLDAENDLAGVRADCERFEEAADRIVREMPSDYSDYDKYRYLATVISLQTSYDYYSNGGYMVGNAYGSILGGLSICEGYSTGFKYLCGKAGLYCTRVGGVVGDMSHMWNRVKLDGQDYYIDVTWSDDRDRWPDSDDWMYYFMVSREFLEEEADHTFQDMDE